jgi:hypothetical protein
VVGIVGDEAVRRQWAVDAHVGDGSKFLSQARHGLVEPPTCRGGDEEGGVDEAAVNRWTRHRFGRMRSQHVDDVGGVSGAALLERGSHGLAEVDPLLVAAASTRQERFVASPQCRIAEQDIAHDGIFVVGSLHAQLDLAVDALEQLVVPHPSRRQFQFDRSIIRCDGAESHRQHGPGYVQRLDDPLMRFEVAALGPAAHPAHRSRQRRDRRDR